MRAGEALGRYHLLAKLAAGGMGEVFVARLGGAGGFEKLVAVKRMLPSFRDDAAAIAMFLEEGRLAARVSHPNVCSVYEIGEADGEYFLAMEYLEGAPLSELLTALARAGAPPPDLRFVGGVLLQACDGLHHAHELTGLDGSPAGVVHRDVSPHNLFVTIHGVTKVLDFGIAKAAHAARTRSTSLKGKAGYMSPEQVLTGQVDRRSDVFSLGTVLFECVTGLRLFRRDTEFATLEAIAREPIPRASEHRPDVPADLDAVIARALERDPQARYATAHEMRVALERSLAELSGPMSPREIGAIVREVAGSSIERRHATIAALASDESGDHTRLGGDERVTETLDVEERTVERAARPRSRTALMLALAAGGIAMVALAGGLVVAMGSGGEASSARSPAATRATEHLERHSGLEPVAALAAEEHDAAVSIERPPRARARSSKRSADRGDGARGRSGFFTVDSMPYATVYIDGRRAGDTPLYRVPLAPGAHRVRAVCSCGPTQHFTISIAPGAAAPARRLVW